MNCMSRYSTISTRLPQGSRKSRKRTRQQFAARSLDECAHPRAIVDDEAEMAPRVVMLGAALHQIDELIAELDKGVARPFSAQSEVEDLAVKGKGLVDIADLEGDVIDADELRPAGVGAAVVGLADRGHGMLLLVAAAHSHYIGSNILRSMSIGRLGLLRTARGSAFSRRNLPLAWLKGRRLLAGTDPGAQESHHGSDPQAAGDVG